ncbi:MAG TPA: glycoside hydrolase family 127 protein [Candidatus Limiplasma sp.]|nr:glycoside hydrolase family 127 protein [Candidatus Limiplasma sp.]
MKNYEIPVRNIRVNDMFWNGQIQNAVEHVIPYQWRVLNDAEPGAEPSHAIANFKIAAGEAQGEFAGFRFQDSDLAKWMEAAAFSLIYKDDPVVRREMEDAITLLEKAQLENGYLDTYYILKKPDLKWKEISTGHELYCAGHMLEAAVAYQQITGSDRFMNVMDKLIDLISGIFGKGEGKLNSVPGHEEIELALMKAYRATGREKYLKLAEYFILNRGCGDGFTKEESYLTMMEKHPDLDPSYYQIHRPLLEQDTAEGHAVRVMYLCTGMADVALATGNKALMNTLHKIWNNVTGKRMYVTGGVGSQGDGERFTIDYDLPNDTCYTETCAAVGLAMWSLRMLRLEPRAEYADVMERALYNNVLSGIAVDGEHYFYVNPLMIKPDVAHYRADHEGVEPVRVKWFGCACCPPNVIRTLCGLGGYVYTQNESRIYQHLYIGNHADIQVAGGKAALECEASMPWEGSASIKVTAEKPFELALRIPGYAKAFTVMRNGLAVKTVVENGYAVLTVQGGDTIEVGFGMDAVFWCANPRVTEDCGKVCLLRGPLVYCAEEIDNGANLQDLLVDPTAPVSVEPDPLFGGIRVLKARALRTTDDGWDGATLYRPYTQSKREPVTVKLIPYFLWNNRGEGEMTVWINRTGE